MGGSQSLRHLRGGTKRTESVCLTSSSERDVTYWCGEWERDEHLEESLRNEDLEQSAVPEALFLLDLSISRVVLAPLD
jgi:hypothetical protein